MQVLFIIIFEIRLHTIRSLQVGQEAMEVNIQVSLCDYFIP